MSFFIPRPRPARSQPKHGTSDRADTGKMPWYTLTAKEATNLDVRFPSWNFWSPLTQYSSECPWPWKSLSMQDDGPCPRCRTYIRIMYPHRDHPNATHPIAIFRRPGKVYRPVYDAVTGRPIPNPY